MLLLMARPIFTDGSAKFGKTTVAIAGAVAVQLDECGWTELRARVPSSMPQDAAAG
jgi:hypothetical protein